MSNQPKTVVVKGHNYTMTHFYADDGARIFLRLAKIAAEPIARAFELKDVKMDDPRFSIILQDVVKSLLLGMDEDVVIKTIAELLSVVIPEGQTYPLYDIRNPSQGNWRVYFQGKQAEMFMVVFEVIKENFADFLAALKLVGVSSAVLQAMERTTGPKT